jgi:hypothetical protein
MNGSSVTSTMYLRIFGSSPNYQTCASSLLSLRFHMVASGHATMVVDIKETGDHEGDVPILHRYKFLSRTSPPISSSSSVKTQPRFNTDALKAFAAMMKQTGIESADPPPDLQDKVCRAGVITAPIQFQINTLQAMRVMEDPESSHGLRHVRNSEELQTSIWPRDSPNPSYSHRTRCHSLHNGPAPDRRATRAGTRTRKAIMIAHTMLKREEGWRNTDRTSWGCAIGPSSLRILTSTLAGTDRSSRAFGCHRNRRQHPTTQKTFRHRDHTSADGLGFQSPLRMNRLCYDEAHVLAAKIPNSITVPYSLQRRPPMGRHGYAFTCQVPI